MALLDSCTTMATDPRVMMTNDSYYGRKRAIFFLCAPLLAGWVTVLLSGGEFATLCVGRVLQGAGIMSSVTQVYLVEIADVKRRWVGGLFQNVQKEEEEEEEEEAIKYAWVRNPKI